MDFIELAKNRYSCKKFDSRQISKDQLTTILEAGRLAPTAKNLQEQHVYVLQSPERLAIVDQHTPCRYGAPTMLIVAFDKNNTYTYPGQKYDSGIEDASIVTTHMMLCAKSVGVDSCWVNCFDPDKMAEAFNLPENEEILTCLALGFPAEGAAPLPNHFNRKPLDATVTYL
ncbi:MAG: nitroreductase family protein [Muribaculaceae bacterium]|nr:nitroreductase family protein [Muribaculaceae bacterium]